MITMDYINKHLGQHLFFAISQPIANPLITQTYLPVLNNNHSSVYFLKHHFKLKIIVFRFHVFTMFFMAFGWNLEHSSGNNILVLGGKESSPLLIKKTYKKPLLWF